MRPTLSVILLAAAVAAPGLAGEEADGAKAAANVFAQALLSRRSESLRPILPESGKVHLALIKLGPEEGTFGASQVEAVFRDFLAAAKVTSFELSRCGRDGGPSALARGRATLVDREGRVATVGLHLGLQLEGTRWVLREVRESAE